MIKVETECSSKNEINGTRKAEMESVTNTVLTGMAGACIEHSAVITNFTATVHRQLKNNVCKVFPDNVQYKWNVNGENKTVIPDASINCRVHARKGNSFFDIPRFVILKIVHFPNIKITYEELFEEIDFEGQG